MIWAGHNPGAEFRFDILFPDVEVEKNVLTLAPKKTERRQGKIIYIPMFPTVREVLNSRQSGKVLNPAGYVFPELAQQIGVDLASDLALRISGSTAPAALPKPTTQQTPAPEASQAIKTALADALAALDAGDTNQARKLINQLLKGPLLSTLTK